MTLHYKNLPDTSVVCLLAPTASGKTQLAFELYKTGRFEIVSVDSALVYRDMDIGTAKPTKAELCHYPHHLVDIIDPTQSYSVAAFVADCQRLMTQIHANGRIPLLVGGTMMYYHALLHGINELPKTHPDVRRYVDDIQRTQGNQAVYDYLLTHDPLICQKLTVHDSQRIGRAMVVHVQTGRALSAWQKDKKTIPSKNKDQHWYSLCITPDRAWLHQNIEKRLQHMWQMGFCDEVRALIGRYPLSQNSQAMSCVGYRQVLDFLLASGQVIRDGDLLRLDLQKDNIEACQSTKNKALYATRQLAKRQYTWLRGLSRAGEMAHVTTAHFDSIEQAKKQLLMHNNN